MLGPEGVAGWESLRVPEDVPMHVEEAPVAEVLAELAQAVRLTDVMFPRQEEEGYVATRAGVVALPCAPAEPGGLGAAARTGPGTDHRGVHRLGCAR